ncbi:hypothetical protein [Streptomyces sp. NPDC002758]
MKRLSKAEKLDHLYVQLPAGLWTNGWIMELSGATLAMYLVLLHERRGGENKAVWLSPRIGRERYDLSDETRRKGLFEDHFRSRNVYEFDSKDLAQYEPGDERDNPFV